MKDHAELKEKIAIIFSEHLNIEAPPAETDSSVFPKRR